MDIQAIAQTIIIEEAKLNEAEDLETYCIELVSDLYKEDPDNKEYVKQLLNEFLRVRNHLRH